jgi:hypothetical protein
VKAGRSLWLAIAVATAALLAAAPAQASVTVSAFSAEPTTTQAGGHPDLTLTTDFAASPDTDDVRDVTVRLAPGLIGDPSGAGRCSQAQFEADACPADSKVGSTEVTAVALLELTSSGDVYNLEPAGSEPARLGIMVRPVVIVPLEKLPLVAPVELRRGEDGYALETTFRNLPTAVGALGIRITRIKLTLNGTTARGPFVRNPTSCGPATSRVSVNSYAAPDEVSSLTASFTPTGCEALPFSPRLEGSVGARGLTSVGTLAPFRTAIGFGPGESAMRRAEVILPPSIGPDTDALARVCPDAALQSGSCPESARIGRASATSPLVPGELSGPVLFAENPGQLLPRLVVQLNGPVSLQLAATVELGTFGTKNVFEGLPDVPLSNFELSLDGGPSGVLKVSRDLCAASTSTTVTGTLVSHSGKSVPLRERLPVNGCSQRPRVSGSLLLGGGSATLSAVVKQAVRGPRLRSVAVVLPRRLGPGTLGRRGVRARSAGRLRGRAVRLRGRRLQLRLGRRGARMVRLRWAGLVPSRSLRPGRRLKLAVRVRDAGGKRHLVRARLRVRTNRRR